ncbi:MAG TPA: hypothetical protein VN894_02055 [Polyangiaceae bacterium]|nr:hypothetical protein [Polyangiaceae bacterium]
MSDDEESPLDSKRRPSEPPNAGREFLGPRAVSTEVACARALLDALETLLRAEDVEANRYDVIVQVADQLARVATTIRQWGATPPGHVRARR